MSEPSYYTWHPTIAGPNHDFNQTAARLLRRVAAERSNDPLMQATFRVIANALENTPRTPHYHGG